MRPRSMPLRLCKKLFLSLPASTKEAVLSLSPKTCTFSRSKVWPCATQIVISLDVVEMFGIASMQITKHGWDENGLGLVLESVFKPDVPRGREERRCSNKFI